MRRLTPPRPQLDASGGQLTQDSTVADLAAVDFARASRACAAVCTWPHVRRPAGLNPVHGPVFVAGAEVGDVLRVEVLRIAPAPFAWTAVFPGFGLLADAGELSVTGPALVKATLPSWPFLRWLRFAGVWVPLSPHVGSMGVAPPVSRGALSTIPPDVHGGNLDTRHVTAGSVALFPVHTPGALFYLGDVHAGQGDGEVCGTALEVAAKVTVRLHVLKRSTPDAAAVTEWQLRTPAWLPLHPGRDGARFITTGFAPDLLTASRKAIRHMMDVLRAKRPEMTTEEAYMVCSISADLRVSQAVDMPHFSVAAHLPAGVLAD
jgi:acetamidase/formamidase